MSVIFVIGATGVGKTKLGIDLARRFNGEVVSADSMQVYKGFDIGTAKATAEEQSAAVHHMLDCCEPQDSFSLTDYLDLAIPIIQDIHRRNKVAIVVGGTMLYVQGLLFESVISSTPRIETQESDEEAYRELVALDPATAAKLHVNDSRRVHRALQICREEGRPASDLIKEQHKQNMDKGLRFRSLLFWLDSSDEALDARLDSRAAKMIDNGLLAEVLTLRTILPSLDYSKGLLQGIGFKEFAPILDDASIQTSDDILPQMVDECLNTLQANTRKYARGQRKWIRNKFVMRQHRLPIFSLDTSDVSRWHEVVFTPAADIVQLFQSDKTPGVEHPFSSTRFLNEDQKQKRQKLEETSQGSSDFCINAQVWKKFHCERCDTVANGQAEMEQHLKSKAHRKRKRPEERHNPQKES